MRFCWGYDFACRYQRFSLPRADGELKVGTDIGVRRWMRRRRRSRRRMRRRSSRRRMRRRKRMSLGAASDERVKVQNSMGSQWDVGPFRKEDFALKAVLNHSNLGLARRRNFGSDAFPILSLPSEDVPRRHLLRRRSRR